MNKTNNLISSNTRHRFHLLQPLEKVYIFRVVIDSPENHQGKTNTYLLKQMQAPRSGLPFLSPVLPVLICAAGLEQLADLRALDAPEARRHVGAILRPIAKYLDGYYQTTSTHDACWCGR